jgi:hypothetical protein
MPLERYQVTTNDSPIIYIKRLDFGAGIVTTIDSIDTTNPSFPDTVVWTRGIDWQVYDPIHRRLFFQEAFTMDPIRTRVYEVDSRRYFSLPYDNYMGQYVDMLISPGSEYIIFRYRFMPHDTIWSPSQYKVIVLGAANLNELAQRVGMTLWTEGGGTTSYVTGNNDLLLNLEYLPISDTSKEHGYVAYSLPDLTPLDTLFYRRTLWRGEKRPVDVGANGILFVGVKADSTRDLPPGTYAYVMDGRERRPSSRIVPIAPISRNDAIITQRSDVRLTPEGDEIVAVYSDSGRVRRYDLSSGQMVGETEVPPGWHFVFFGEDGDLYLRHGWEPEYMAVDYRNNRIVRSFQFERR